LHLIPVLYEKGKDSGAGSGGVRGRVAAYNPKEEKKKAFLSSIAITTIQASKLLQNPLFLSFFLFLCATRNKGHFFKENYI